jgi:hypothetical protein
MTGGAWGGFPFPFPCFLSLVWGVFFTGAPCVRGFRWGAGKGGPSLPPWRTQSACPVVWVSIRHHLELLFFEPCVFWAWGGCFLVREGGSRGARWPLEVGFSSGVALWETGGWHWVGGFALGKAVFLPSPSLVVGCLLL